MTVHDTRKTVLITGCTPGGIGHAICRAFHSKGLHVIATARSKDAIQDLEAMGMSTLSLEVTSSESIMAAKAEVEKLTEGRLDILVNNAGRNCTVPACDVELEEARECFDVNFFAVVAITKAFTPMLIAAKGLILNIGSIAAIMPYVFGSVYNASKAALHSYSQTLRLELAPFDVRVLVVVTGGVKSRIARNKRDLPENSLYMEIAEDYEKRLVHSQAGAMDTDSYAQGVVSEALKPNWRQKKWLWRGNKIWLVWFVSRILGGFGFDWVLPRMFGLDKLRSFVLARERRPIR